ncbi:hypothetical protein JN06_01833 [Bacteroides zoogleoformans]|nr:hypothetical protein JN06_01833 [Bacteroides zoogleoformans]
MGKHFGLLFVFLRKIVFTGINQINWTEMKKSMLKKYRPTLLGVLLGVLAGYLYWRFIGCSTGSCPITSSPIYSSIWGGLLGGLSFNAFQKEPKDSKYESQK